MFVDLIKQAIDEIRANKAEVILTMMGIIVGIAAVTIILALGEGITTMIKQKIATYRENVILVAYSPSKIKSATSADAIGSGGAGPMAGILKMIQKMGSDQRAAKEAMWPLPFDIKQNLIWLRRNPYVDSCEFLTRMNSKLSIYDREKKKIVVSFMQENYGYYLKDEVSMGRTFSTYEVEKKVPVTILKANDEWRTYFVKHGGILNQFVTLEGVTFKVIGVIYTAGMNLEAMIPYSFYPDMAMLQDLPQFVVKLKPNENVSKSTELFFQWQKEYGLNGEYFIDDSNIGLFNQVLVYLPKFTLMMSVIAGISLVVGGIGIMNSMLSSVVKRTKEIGIRKSIGATNYAMIFQFMVETVLISSIGGAIGILIGVGLSAIALKLVGVPPVLPVLSIIYCSMFTFIIGLSSGLVPAIKAAKMDPIDALGHT